MTLPIEPPIQAFPPDPIHNVPRDRCIPLRTEDVTRLVLDDPAWNDLERSRLAEVARLLAAAFHHESLARKTELKLLYARLDPDSEICASPLDLPKTLDSLADDRFLEAFERALVRGNYSPLELDVVEQAVKAPNEQGLNYVPNFQMFEQLRVHVRGRAKIARVVRNIKTKMRKQTIYFDGFRRVIVTLKFRDGVRGLGDYASSDFLYMRMFKDVPFCDMEMHLPEQGSKVRMRWLDKAQIASPIAVGLPTFAAKILGMTGATGLLGLFALPYTAVAALMVMPISAGVNSFFGFQRAKQKHLHKVIRSLYYLTVANNSGVISHLIDSVEEEEFKEALLAFSILSRGRDDPTPWTARRLDLEIERIVQDATRLDLDFEIDDALSKLLRLDLIRRKPSGAFVPVSLDDASNILRRRWAALVEPIAGTEPIPH